MGELVRICGKAELPGVGLAKEFLAGGKLLCIANVGGKICAIDNECPHHGGPLGQGTIEEGKIVCPWHSWNIDPITGQASHFPQAKVQVYELTYGDDGVFVKI
jgi:nitrite reductase (NADH) small subunit